MSNDEKKFQPIFQILHIKSAWFLLELAMALVTTIGLRFLQVCLIWVKKFSFSPQKCKLELCMSNGSKILIYLSFLLKEAVF